MIRIVKYNMNEVKQMFDLISFQQYEKHSITITKLH